MAMPRLSEQDHARVLRLLERMGCEPQIAEALGVVDYEGHDTIRQGKSKKERTVTAYRFVETYDEEAERERLRLMGSSHANLAPPSNPAFHAGFNNYRRSA